MPEARIRTLRNAPALFALAAATVVAMCVAIVRSRLFPLQPDITAWAVTFDLTVTIPLLYYLLVVRSGRTRPLTVAPVFAIGAALAAIVIPGRYQQFLHDLRFVAAPLEIVTLLLIASKVRSVRGASQAGRGDACETIAAASKQIFGDTIVARAVASEIATLWFAVASWKKVPDVPAGATPVTVHQKSGWGTVVVCIVVLIGAESIGMHLLLQMWSTRAAWIATALDLYGILWLIGDYNAIRLRPSLITADELLVRHGLRWSVAVPLQSIVSVDAVVSEAEWRRKGVLRVALVDDPRFIVRLSSPSTAYGIAALTKRVEAIAFGPDEERAISGLRSACATAAPGA